jgi:hypothetical protein
MAKSRHDECHWIGVGWLVSCGYEKTDNRTKVPVTQLLCLIALVKKQKEILELAYACGSV